MQSAGSAQVDNAKGGIGAYYFIGFVYSVVLGAG
jgi:hypothetical protein